MDKISIDFTLQELGLVVAGLMELPFKLSAPLIKRLNPVCDEAVAQAQKAPVNLKSVSNS